MKLLLLLVEYNCSSDDVAHVEQNIFYCEKKDIMMHPEENETSQNHIFVNIAHRS